MASFTFHVVTSYNEFLGLEKSWKDLHKDHAFSIHTDFNWVNSWGKYHLQKGAELKTIVISHNNKIVGILPLRLEKRKYQKITKLRSLQFLAAGPSDWNDIITKNTNEDLYSQLVPFLQKNIHWDELLLSDLHESSLLLKWMGNGASVKPATKCYTINTTGEWDTYLKTGVSKNFVRQDVRRLHNRLKKEQMPFSMTESNYTSLATDFKRIQKMHTSSQQRQGRESFFMDKEINGIYTLILKHYAENSKLRIFFLNIDETPVSYIITLQQKLTLFYWNIGFNANYAAYSPSKLLLFELLKMCFHSDIEELNFMRGETSYKTKWAKDYTTNYHVRILNQKTIKGKLLSKFGTD